MKSRSEGGKCHKYSVTKAKGGSRVSTAAFNREGGKNRHPEERISLEGH